MFVAGVLVLACCCFCGNRDDDPGPRSQAREQLAAMAYAEATEAARAKATASVAELEAALRRELPSLVLLDTAVKDWCDERECVLQVDYFFGIDSDPQQRIETVLRRDGTAVTTSRSPCPELLYESRGPDLSNRARHWMSRALWAGPADPLCAQRLRPAPEITDPSAYPVRVKDVEVTALLAGVRGKHRFIVQIGVGGWYHSGGTR